MRNWKTEMDLDADLTIAEKERFLELVEAAGIPSIEDVAEEQGKTREDIQDAYWQKYGEQITDLRNQATEEE